MGGDESGVYKLSRGINDFRIGKDSAAIKYVVNVDYDISPEFLEEAYEVHQLQRPVYVMAEEREMGAMVRKGETLPTPLLKGEFDHRRYALFYLTDSDK